MNDLKLKLSSEILAIALLSLVVVCESIQFVMLLFWILGHFPQYSALNEIVFTEWRPFVYPERDVLLYRSFIISSVVLMFAALKVFGRRLVSNAFFEKLRTFALLEGLLVGALLTVQFKLVIYDYQPFLAQKALQVLFILAILNKFFWDKVPRFLKAIESHLIDSRNTIGLTRWFVWMFPVVIFLFICVPDPQAAIARMFIGEQFHHNDSFLFGPAWAYVSGAVLNIDVISQYGLGAPIVIAQLTKLFGGFSYEHGLMVMVFMTIIYFILWFFLLRQWLYSALLAAAAIIVAIKIQMFHPGVYPFVFTYGSSTVVRYYFDIFALAMLWMHLTRGQSYWLWIAGIFAGIQIFHLTTEGIYLTFAFYSYIIIHLIFAQLRGHMMSSLKALPQMIGLLLTPLATAVAILAITHGKYLATAEFWNNLGEFIGYFLSSFGLIPYVENLKNANHWAFVMGLVIPAVYACTLIILGSLAICQRLTRVHVFPMVLSIYGLGLYHYFVGRSTLTSYYVAGLPFVFLCFFWLRMLIAHFDLLIYRRIVLGVFVCALFALLTNHNFVSYPNLLSLSRNPYTDPNFIQRLPTGGGYFNHLFRDYAKTLELPLNSLGEKDAALLTEKDFATDQALKAYVRQKLDFQADADLIARLTPENSAAPVVSSFEIPMLMQANRRPFFYYFPLVISRPLQMRLLVSTSIYTTTQMQKVLKKLEADKPPYVFMERLFLQRGLTNEHFYVYPSLTILLEYINQYYSPAETGQYLVAMKRKN